MGRVLELFRKPIPREHFKSLDEIPYDRLKLWGFEVIIFDYDNTLAPFLHQIQDEVLNLLKDLIEMGFKIAVVTNASYERTKKLRNNLPQIKVFAKAKKPGLKVLKSALRTLNVPPDKVVFVGDLFFTDIIAGNRMGMYTIMVEPYPGVGVVLNALVFLEKISYYFIFYTFGWLFRIGELISPNELADTVFDVNYDRLISNGIKLFVFDMDGTLTKWRSNQVNARTLRLLNKLSRTSKVVILSNGGSPALDVMIKNGIKVFKHAHKPLTGKMMKVMKMYGVSKKEVAVIGDQLFTDVLMANLAGLYSVKIQPISKDEMWFTKFLRILERIVKPFTRKKPSIGSDNEWQSVGNQI